MRRSPGFAIGEPASNGMPDACASRCRTVDPGGPAGSSRSSTPSSAATRQASPVASFEIDAQRNSSALPCRNSVCWADVTPTATRCAGQASTSPRASISMDTRSMHRQLISSGSPYEPVMGFSRAVRVGQHVFVAGTAPVMPAGEELPSDAYGQTKRCLEIIVGALEQAGATPEHVVRTRIFATSAGIFEEVARAHGAVFGDAKPACTFVITELIDPRWHVEIEAEAVIP